MTTMVKLINLDFCDSESGRFFLMGLKNAEVKHEKPAETDGVGIAKDEEDNEHFAHLEESLVPLFFEHLAVLKFSRQF